MTKNNKIEEKPQRADLDKQQKETFMNSNEYVMCNARLELVINILYCANKKYEEVEKILSQYEGGLFLKGMLKSRLEGAKTNAEAVKEQFCKTFFSSDWKRKCTEKNNKIVEKIINERLDKEIEDGIKLQEMRRARLAMGRGCDTCLKFRTQHCTYSLLADEEKLKVMEFELGCYGHQNKH